MNKPAVIAEQLKGQSMSRIARSLELIEASEEILDTSWAKMRNAHHGHSREHGFAAERSGAGREEK